MESDAGEWTDRAEMTFWQRSWRGFKLVKLWPIRKQLSVDSHKTVKLKSLSLWAYTDVWWASLLDLIWINKKTFFIPYHLKHCAVHKPSFLSLSILSILSWRQFLAYCATGFWGVISGFLGCCISQAIHNPELITDRTGIKKKKKNGVEIISAGSVWPGFNQDIRKMDIPVYDHMNFNKLHRFPHYTITALSNVGIILTMLWN